MERLYPARTAISDENGVAVMSFVNSGPEGTFHLRAHAQGYGHVEWRIVVQWRTGGSN